MTEATRSKFVCRGCGRALVGHHYLSLADGCPCNSPRGVNHGLVPKHVCTCAVCDPKQTGSVRPCPAKPRVIIESPFGRRVDGTPCTPAEIERNTRYVRRALADSLRRGEAPFASHALYPLVLDDATPEERRAGMEAGFAWGEVASIVVYYVDHGITEGMIEGRLRHEANHLPIEERSIGAEPDLPVTDEKGIK